jgi:hypothetical protein
VARHVESARILVATEMKSVYHWISSMQECLGESGSA